MKRRSGSHPHTISSDQSRPGPSPAIVEHPNLSPSEHHARPDRRRGSSRSAGFSTAVQTRQHAGAVKMEPPTGGTILTAPRTGTLSTAEE